jgi:hypothetical protein
VGEGARSCYPTLIYTMPCGDAVGLRLPHLDLVVDTLWFLAGGTSARPKHGGGRRNSRSELLFKKEAQAAGSEWGNFAFLGVLRPPSERRCRRPAVSPKISQRGNSAPLVLGPTGVTTFSCSCSSENCSSIWLVLQSCQCKDKAPSKGASLIHVHVSIGNLYSLLNTWPAKGRSGSV